MDLQLNLSADYEYLDNVLELDKVSINYGNNNVIDDFSLSCYKKSHYLLTGPNGSGKSTILKAICGLVNTSSGRIFCRNQEITRFNLKKRFDAGIIYFMQDRNVFSSLSVKDNFEIAGFSMKKEVYKNKMDEFNEKFPNIFLKYKKSANSLSGGERRILGLLMILLHDPYILLLDEPYNGLSANSRDAVHSILSTYIEKKDIVTITVEHASLLKSNEENYRNIKNNLHVCCKKCF